MFKNFINYKLITINYLIPSGRPASEKSSANLIAHEGFFSEGFKIKLFPHAIAIGNIHIGTTGKLKME